MSAWSSLRQKAERGPGRLNPNHGPIIINHRPTPSMRRSPTLQRTRCLLRPCLCKGIALVRTQTISPQGNTTMVLCKAQYPLRWMSIKQRPTPPHSLNLRMREDPAHTTEPEQGSWSSCRTGFQIHNRPSPWAALPVLPAKGVTPTSRRLWLHVRHLLRMHRVRSSLTGVPDRLMARSSPPPARRHIYYFVRPAAVITPSSTSDHRNIGVG